MLSKRSLRSRINITIALIMSGTILLFGSALAIHEVQRRGDALQQMELALRDLTAQHQTQVGNEIFAAHVIALKASLEKLLQRKGLLCIDTYDDLGEPVLSLGRDAPPGAPEKSAPLDQPAMAGPSSSLDQWRGRQVLTFTSPLLAHGETAGFWRLRYSLATLNSQTVEVVMIFALLILLPFVCIFLLLNRLLARFVWKPVYQLKDTMRLAQGLEGRADGGQAPGQGCEHMDQMIRSVDGLLTDSFQAQTQDNEIASLAHSFRHMLAELKAAYIGNRTDVLTGLSNRLKLDEALQTEIRLSRRLGSHFSILMLDLDKFKNINDCFGHLVGDQVLQHLGVLLRSFFRQTDTPGRWGGEEFLVLLPGLTAEQADVVAERLRQHIEAEDFPGAGRCTASIGVAQHLPGESMEELIARVDEALYLAKETGRNRVARAK